MAVISFQSYGYSPEPVRVMVERITHFYGVDYNGRSGTTIVLDTGKEVTVGEYSSDVQRKIEEAQKEH
jgi:hypothetical protein